MEPIQLVISLMFCQTKELPHTKKLGLILDRLQCKKKKIFLEIS